MGRMCLLLGHIYRHLLGNRQHVLGNGPHVLVNGPHVCIPFMKSYHGEVRLGSLFILALFG